MEEENPTPQSAPSQIGITPAAGSTGYTPLSGTEKSSPPSSQGGWENVPKMEHKRPPPDLPDETTQKLERTINHQIEIKLDTELAKYTEQQTAANQKMISDLMGQMQAMQLTSQSPPGYIPYGQFMQRPPFTPTPQRPYPDPAEVNAARESGVFTGGVAMGATGSTNATGQEDRPKIESKEEDYANAKWNIGQWEAFA